MLLYSIAYLIYWPFFSYKLKGKVARNNVKNMIGRMTNIGYIDRMAVSHSPVLKTLFVVLSLYVRTMLQWYFVFGKEYV